MKYRLKHDTLYEFRTLFYSRAWTLKAGEICEYFEHSDTYLFDARDGVVPFFSRETVLSNPQWFEPVAERALCDWRGWDMLDPNAKVGDS